MVKIISQNVHGINDFIKHKSIFYYLRQRADIVCLQETHSDKKTEESWGMQWGDSRCFWSHWVSNARGVGILINKACDVQITNHFRDNQGRYVGIEYEDQGEKFILVNIYAPNGDELVFFTDVFVAIEQCNGRRIIVGDFNLVLDVEHDRTTGSLSNNIKSSEIIKQYMEKTAMIDIWRDRNIESRMYTYMRKKQM